jgi:hypothetical protein
MNKKENIMNTFSLKRETNDVLNKLKKDTDLPKGKIIEQSINISLHMPKIISILLQALNQDTHEKCKTDIKDILGKLAILTKNESLLKEIIN